MRTPDDGLEADDSRQLAQAVLADVDALAARLAARIEAVEPAYRNVGAIPVEDL